MKQVRFIVFLLLVILAAQTRGQVTVGISEATIDGALLQLKNKENVIDDGYNAHKGLALPRVTLSQKKQLYPMFLVTPTDSTSGPNSDYSANKATIDKIHTGLIVYNLTEDEDKDLCKGLNQWDGEKWNCFEQKATNAQFDIVCDSIKVLGDYGDGVALNSSNYLRVTLNVTRIGAYSISATSSPDNGYFFETSGIFLSIGTFTITVPGTGQPVNHTQGADLVDTNDDTPDKFTLTSSGGGSNCQFEVNVRSTAARPEFEIDCQSTVVEGMYFEDVALSSTPNSINGQANQLRVKLKDIPTSAFGAVAIVETNTVDGFSFKGQAVLSSSPQEIILVGTGTPRGLNDKTFTITCNSVSSTASCQTTVYMLIPRKRLMTLGNTDSFYSYNAGIVDTRNPPNNINTLLTDKNNFGYNQWSILKFAGFTNQGTTWNSNFVSNPNTWVDDDRDIVALQTSTWQSMSTTTLSSLLNGTDGKTKVDIFMIGYDTEYYRNGNADDAARCALLVDFVKNGGILMICSEQTDSNGNFINLLFDNPSPAIGSASGGSLGSNYTLGYDSGTAPVSMKPYYCKDDDAILRGPFGDIVGRNWGEDASTTKYVTNLPLDEVVIYAGARPIGTSALPADGVTIFRHREYPFVFIGDGGFNSAQNRSYQNTTSPYCPFVLTSKTINGRVYSNYPTYRYNFGGAGNLVYNAVFSANAFAWCILQAEEWRRSHK